MTSLSFKILVSDTLDSEIAFGGENIHTSGRKVIVTLRQVAGRDSEESNSGSEIAAFNPKLTFRASALASEIFMHGNDCS